MSKSVPIRLRPRAAAQAFVEAGEEPRARELVGMVKSAADKAGTVRITLDLPRGVHRKLKVYVAGEGITISDYLRDLLDRNLP